MMKFLSVLCVLALCTVVEVNCAHHHHHHQASASAPAPAPAHKHVSSAPTPSPDCSTVIFNMADCLSFVSSGSDVSKPEGNCCSGFVTVLDTGADCLCEALKSSADMGIVVNATKAMALPSACGVSVPSGSQCDVNGAPGSAPASPTPVVPAASPSGVLVDVPAPAPAENHSDATMISISFVAFLVSMVVVSFSCF